MVAQVGVFRTAFYATGSLVSARLPSLLFELDEDDRIDQRTLELRKTQHAVDIHA
jgi:hypothetical protein